MATIEGSAYNGHFGSFLYHRLTCSTQFGDLERSFSIQRSTAPTAGATFWNPSLSVTGNGTCAATSEGMRPSPHRTSMVSGGRSIHLRHPSQSQRGSSGKHRPSALPSRWPSAQPCAALLRQFQLSGWKLGDFVAKVEWHPGELYPRVGFIVTNLSRPAVHVWRNAFYNQRGKAEQYIKEGKNAIKWTTCRRFRQCRPAQLHDRLAYNLANFRTLAECRTEVEHDGLDQREKLGEDRCQSGQSWPVRHVPIGRGCRSHVECLFQKPS